MGKSWNGKDRLTVVLQNVSGENKTEEYRLAVISIEPSQEKGNYLYLKPNFLLDIPYGYKTYPVYSIYKLGRLDKTRGGEKLIKSSIETTLGIKTDRYLLFTDKNGPELPDRKESFNKFKHDNLTIFSGFPFLAGLYSGRVSTDMTLIERIRFFWEMRNLRIDQIKYIDPSVSVASREELLPDNSRMYSLDRDLFDNLIKNDFTDIRVRKEDYTLEVQNATGQEKIASQFSRILDHMGAHVVFKTTSKDINRNICLLRFSNNTGRESYVSRILKADYKCQESKEGNGVSQADIQVIIGEGFLK